jgi:hypothetical protein
MYSINVDPEIVFLAIYGSRLVLEWTTGFMNGEVVIRLLILPSA